MSNKGTTSDLIGAINDKDKAVIWSEFLDLYRRMSQNFSQTQKLPFPLLLTSTGLKLDKKISDLILYRCRNSEMKSTFWDLRVTFCGFVHEKNMTDKSKDQKIIRDKRHDDMIPIYKKRLEEIKGGNSMEKL